MTDFAKSKFNLFLAYFPKVDLCDLLPPYRC
jgi:hypothetical protein